MTAIILTYYKNRRKYLPMIIECLKANHPDRIIVFDQSESNDYFELDDFIENKGGVIRKEKIVLNH